MLAIAVCAFAGLFMGLGYAALTTPPFTAQAQVLLPSGAPVPGGAGVHRLSSNIVQIVAQGGTAAQAEAADAAAVRNYLAKAERAWLVSESFAPRHPGRTPAFAALGALVGALAGALGAATRRRVILV